MRGSLVHTLSSGYGAAAWTPAQLPAGVLLAWYNGHDLGDLAALDNGTGAVTGADDSSTVGRWTDRAQGKHAQQATSGSRPIAGYHTKGRGISVHPGTGRHLIGASALSGGRHLYAVVSFVGANSLVTSEEAAAFAADSQGIVSTSGAVDAAHSFLVGLAGGGALWTSGSLSGPAVIDGVTTTSVGRQRRRRVVRFDRNADATSGAINLLQSSGGAIPSLSTLHEVIVLDDSATSEHHALVTSYLAWHLAAPVIACTLDSLTAGYNLNAYQSVPSLLWERYRRCASVVNLGVTGQTIATAITGDPAKLDTVVGLGRNVLVLLGGANDIAGVSAATVWSRLQSYIAMARARGWEVVICTLPNGAYWATIGAATKVTDTNALIEAGWEAEGCIGMVDLYPLSLTQPDGLHYNAADAVLVAAEVGAVLDTLL